MSMDIYTKPGSKIKFCNFENGKPQDKQTANTYLTKGAIYTVKEILAEDMRTEVKLKEIPRIWFNSVHFDNVRNRIDDIPKNLYTKS